MKPLIDICVPTYNPQPQHLKEALDNIRAQTLQDWTVFIHDDASHVDVAAMVKPYLTDPRFSFERGIKRRGIGGNWNTCVRHGHATFVQLLFQDDRWDKSYLARAAKVLQSDETIGMVSANHQHLTLDGKPATGIYEEIKTEWQKLKSGKYDGQGFLFTWLQKGLRPNIIGEPSFVMLRRSCMDTAGPFLTDMSQLLDSEYWVRMLLIGQWYWTSENGGVFRVHASGASAKNSASGRGALDRLRTLQRLITYLPVKEDRLRAMDVHNDELRAMIRKFFRSSQEKQQTEKKGDGRPNIFHPKHIPLFLTAIKHYVQRIPARRKMRATRKVA